ncbi:unnamed protein product [Vicia faba]|uniref:Reverse transcriptase domain-containing protein n=1 Tax=Vicia faba TaxID=3906 RepID=A0AAV1AU03_VICFA|nr:unnamed protein product [Vicia faba]
MKAVTKSIANRLKTFLPGIISEKQSAFIWGRLITDNALIAMECFHWMKHKKNGRKGTMALKLDTSKASDRLEWNFVSETLEKNGISPSHPNKKFFPNRGLHQGDPFSPYLFVIYADVLSRMIRSDMVNNKIHGIKVERKSPIISHLFSVDDSLMFSRASEEEVG